MMKKFILALFLFLTYTASFAQQNGWRKGEMELKVPLSNPANAIGLNNLKLNAEMGTGFVWVYATPDELSQLQQAGITYEISIADLNAHYANYWDNDVPNGYYTWQQIKGIADSLATNFPSICKKYTYGFSAGNHELAALKISDNASRDENEPEILFDGGIHGDEVGGSQNIIMFARKLCLSYGSDPYITSLVDGREIWLYYCVNPDGRINMSRYNGNQVDINRDWGYMWEGEGNSPGSFSQPETKALRNCMSENQFVVYTNYHSGTVFLAYPWSYRAINAPDKPYINDLASVYASSSGYSNLPFAQGYSGMYPINGSTKDFNYGALGSVAWSMEISTDKQPPSNQIGYYYSINEPAMLAMAEYAGYGIEGVVTDAKTGFPVRASIFLGNNYPVYTDDSLGDYHKYVIPGNYTLKVMANGYQTQIISNVVVTPLSPAVTNIQLQPILNQYAYKVASCRIPGNNFYDEGYTAACLGAADLINYSIGFGGNIVLDLQDILTDSVGMDLKVYEGDATPEGYTVSVSSSRDGPWTLLGSGMGTKSFDLAVVNVRFIKIIDDSNGSFSGADVGFDLDAIEAIHPYSPDSLGTLSGFVYNALTGFGLSGAEVKAGIYTTTSGANGEYLLTVPIGLYTVACASKIMFATSCDTLTIHSGEAIDHDFQLMINTGFENQIPDRPLVSIEPNPFSDETRLRIKLAKLSATHVEILNLTGNKVANLLQVELPAGEYNYPWNGSDDNGAKLPGGVYICRVSIGDSHKCLKIILLR